MSTPNQKTKPSTGVNSIALFGQVLHAEADAILQVADRLGPEVDAAVELLLNLRGRVIFTGLGKTGYVARKAAATFCSTGTPAFYLHPTEALHGDLGMVTSGDVLVAVSNSGETEEVVTLIPFMARMGVPVIALTGNSQSSLALRSSAVLDTFVHQEADEISGAPTSSTTVAMAMCDAMAVTLMRHRGFTGEQFAIFHPGGSLGRKLLLKVGDLMRVGDSVPKIDEHSRLAEAIDEISGKKLGAVFVVADSGKIAGILTDGDLRRTFQREPASQNIRSNTAPVTQFMTRDPKLIGAESLAAEAIKLMEDNEITVLGVVDQNSSLVGAIHLHDLIRAGLA